MAYWEQHMLRQYRTSHRGRVGRYLSATIPASTAPDPASIRLRCQYWTLRRTIGARLPVPVPEYAHLVEAYSKSVPDMQ
eukprot:3459421-Rhodomonas_salina.2